MRVKHEPVITLAEAAEEVGSDYRVLSGLVELLGIETKPVPHSPRGRGLDRHDMRRIRRALAAGRKPVMARASA